ncbi:MAG: hypothetical protein IJM83_05655 [Firmicutes bacterium]|nr:hypothetical protein [Bacillota bacterium]
MIKNYHRNRGVRILALLLILTLSAMLLGGCRKRSEYDDASVSVPDTYASYDVGDFHFRFEAGWESTNWDELSSTMDGQAALLGLTSNMAIYWRMYSPTTAIGTVNYLDFGYFEVGREVQTSDLEKLMEPLDEQASTLKKLGISCDELQKARIRSYNRAEVEALTYCYLVKNEYVTDVVQVALIARGSRVYTISLNDFTSGGDTALLEQLLSTLTIDEPEK